MNPSPPIAAPRVPLAELTPAKALLPNGVELRYAMGGGGPTLVFVHGAMGDWRSWEPQWDAFTAHFRCVTYSRRYSHPNRNDMPSPRHSALDEAQDLRLLLETLGWPDAIVVGSSYGGFIALALAASHPERVRAVVAVEPPMMKYAAFTAEGQAAAERFRAEVIVPANAAFRAGDDEAAARIMTGGINGPAAPALTPDAMARRMQNVRAMKMLALSSDEFPLISPATLAALPMPVLLVSGVRTELLHRAIFENVCAAMPGAQHVRIPGGGHGISREQPSAFNEAVLSFLRSGQSQRRIT